MGPQQTICRTCSLAESVDIKQLCSNAQMGLFSLDIGGTLAKVAYYCEETLTIMHDDQIKYLSSQESYENNCSKSHMLQKRSCLRFEYFHTKDIKQLFKWLKEKDLLCPGKKIPVTGGGAFKYQELLRTELNVCPIKYDEMECLMTGSAHLIQQPNEVYRYDMHRKCRVPYDVGEEPYPFLLINIGSGVSILHAQASDCFCRLTGTCIGGGTVLGLARLLLEDYTFEEVIELSRKGTNALDLVVKDLYGDAAGSSCLPSTTLASSFGRLYINPPCPLVNTVRPEDVARSLVTMVSYNIGYLACLIGRIHHVTRFMFAGKFIHNHDVTMEAICQAVEFYDTYYGHERRGSHGARRRHFNKLKYFMNVPLEKDLRTQNIYQQTPPLHTNPPVDSLQALRVSDQPNEPDPRDTFSFDTFKVPDQDEDVYQKRSSFKEDELKKQQSRFSSSDYSDKSQSTKFCKPTRLTPSTSTLFLAHDGYLGCLGAFLLMKKAFSY